MRNVSTLPEPEKSKPVDIDQFPDTVPLFHTVELPDAFALRLSKSAVHPLCSSHSLG
jgi:hypothetical protein